MEYDLDESLIQFVRGASGSSMCELAKELERLGALGGGRSDCWRRASQPHWEREFKRLVDAGMLEVRDGCLYVAKPRAVESEKPIQLGLFD